MSATEAPIKVGDRFEDTDPRSGDRVIEIITEVIPGRYFRYAVRVSSLAPWTVSDPNKVPLGRRISATNLRRRYKKVTR